MIILIILGVYLWNHSPLSAFSIQLISLLIIIYIATIVKSKTILQINKELSQISILLLVVLLLVSATGGIESSLFFLLYFIPFALSLVYKPETVFVLASGLIGFFLLQGVSQNLVSTLPILASLVFLSPLAYYFGKQFRRDTSQSNNQEVAQNIDRDVNQIITTEKDNLSSQSIQNLGDIVDQSEKLKTKSEQT